MAKRYVGPDYIEQDCGYETPCWVWQRGSNGNGYGGIWTDGKWRRAHRVFYERHVGPIPAGLDIDHLCRVTRCVNPEHLEPVTEAVNVQRGRLAKLTEEDVRRLREDMRRVRGTGPYRHALAARYGVSVATIDAIRLGYTWKNTAQTAVEGVI